MLFLTIYYISFVCRKAQWKYITLVALAVVVRPTAAIVWLPLVMWHMWMYRSSFWKLTKMFAERGYVLGGKHLKYIRYTYNT